MAPSEALVSVPANIDLVGGSCIQSGTAGAGGAGTDLSTGFTIELSTSCSINAGNTVQVYFTADAPSATGSFYFTVATSTNGTLASSNTVNVGTSAGDLTASGYGFGSNAQYTISNVTVSGLTANENSILLVANVTLGVGNITWYNATGGAGYSVTVTPPGGSAFSDPVTSATVLGNGVTLALGDALAEGDVLNITATGTNPVSSGNDAVDIVVAPGNGTSVTTSSITFGNSVTAVTVSPASTLAGASTTYNVSFKTSSAVPVSGDIFLSETGGPTNFTGVTGVEVVDNTQNTHFVASGAVLSDGSATIPVATAINAGDFVSLTLANVLNPAAATISDFKVSTSDDVLPTAAAAYTIGASASPGVSVNVSPTSLSALATYTISNVRSHQRANRRFEHDSDRGPERDGLPQHRLALHGRGLHDPLGLGRGQRHRERRGIRRRRHQGGQQHQRRRHPGLDRSGRHQPEHRLQHLPADPPGQRGRAGPHAHHHDRTADDHHGAQAQARRQLRHDFGQGVEKRRQIEVELQDQWRARAS